MLHFIEPVASADSRQEIQCTAGNEKVQREESGGNRIRENKLRPDPASALRKYEREMDKEGRLEKQGDDVAPVNNLIERIQLAAVVKTVENERDEAEDVEVNCAGRVPAARKNKKPDE